MLSLRPQKDGSYPRAKVAGVKQRSSAEVEGGMSAYAVARCVVGSVSRRRLSILLIPLVSIETP